MQAMISGEPGGDRRRHPGGRRRPGADRRPGRHLRRGAARRRHLSAPRQPRAIEAGLASGSLGRVLASPRWKHPDAAVGVRRPAAWPCRPPRYRWATGCTAIDINPVILGACRRHRGRCAGGPSDMHDGMVHRHLPGAQRRRLDRGPGARRSPSSRASRCRWPAIDDPAVLADIVGAGRGDRRSRQRHVRRPYRAGHRDRRAGRRSVAQHAVRQHVAARGRGAARCGDPCGVSDRVRRPPARHRRTASAAG